MRRCCNMPLHTISTPRPKALIASLCIPGGQWERPKRLREFTNISHPLHHNYICYVHSFQSNLASISFYLDRSHTTENKSHRHLHPHLSGPGDQPYFRQHVRQQTSVGKDMLPMIVFSCFFPSRNYRFHKCRPYFLIVGNRRGESCRMITYEKHESLFPIAHRLTPQRTQHLIPLCIDTISDSSPSPHMSKGATQDIRC
ncbi:hypothetical protein BJ165DRAFT_383581 [Panaeolus papilionaceus]|nr:hypothetical protein BJ165DRAFT_383581 [Panaeolus papilionaceus]